MVKNGFLGPAGTKLCSDKRQIWHEGYREWTAGPLPHAKFRVCRGRSVGIQPQTVKICNFANKFARQRRLVCTTFTRLSVAFVFNLVAFE